MCGRRRCSPLWPLAYLLLAAGLIPLRAGISALEQDWAVHYSATPPYGTEAAGLGSDSAGNLYLATHAYTPSNDWDIVLAKFSSTGSKLWESRHFSGGTDFAAAVGVAGAAVYVTGSEGAGNGNRDFVTLGYSAADGSLLWAARYDGPVHGADYALALAVDALGNVVVAGNSKGAYSDLDYAVVKYRPDGTQLWVARYDGPGSGEDRLETVQVDVHGNVYLLGTATGLQGEPTLVTVKLDSNGQRLWTAQVAPINSSHHGQGLALDGMGNAIALGTSGPEVVTTKYDPLGNQLWSTRYFAEEPAPMIARSVRVDGAGHVFVGANLFGSGTNDAVVIKYDADGRQLWASRVVARSQEAYHLAELGLDAFGNVYITGAPYPDMFTVKLNPDGDQVGSATYNSTGNHVDYAELLEVGAAGQLYVAGRSIYFTETFVSVVRYEPSQMPALLSITAEPESRVVAAGSDVTFAVTAAGPGPIQYQWRFTGRPIPGATGPTLILTNVQAYRRGDYSVVVSSGPVTVTSREARLTVLVPPAVSVLPAEQTAVMGSAAGFIAQATGTYPFAFQWRHEGTEIPGATNNLLQFEDLSPANAGAYTVTVTNPAGSVTSSNAILSVSEQVEQFWAVTYNGPANNVDKNPLLQVDASGDIIVAGQSQGTGTGADIVTAKYRPNGELVWTSRFNRSGDGEDLPNALALDSSDNIYVAGRSGAPYQDAVFTTIKYDAAGVELWARHFSVTNGTETGAFSIGVGSDGSVVVAGKAAGELVAVKYNPMGDQLWVYRKPNSGYDEHRPSVAVDGAGNVYLGGTLLTATDSDFFLTKLDPAGAELWADTNHFGENAILIGLALDRQEYVVVAGYSVFPSFIDEDEEEKRLSRDLVALKYSPDGARLWATHLDGRPGQQDFTRTLIIDADDQIVVAGSIENYDDDPLGTLIVRLDWDGRVISSTTIADLQINPFTRLAVDRTGHTYVTGTGSRPGSSYDLLTVKLDRASQRIWQAHYTSPLLGTDQGVAVALGPNDEVYAAGNARARVGEGTDWVLVKYTQPAPLRLEIVRWPDGTIHLSMPPGSHTLEASTDLLHWAPLEASMGAGGSLNLSPAGTVEPWLFYRLVQP